MKKAIEFAIHNLSSNDILIVSGKVMKIHKILEKKIFFSDKQVIKNSIKIKNKSLSNNLKVNILKECVDMKIQD